MDRINYYEKMENDIKALVSSYGIKKIDIDENDYFISYGIEKGKYRLKSLLNFMLNNKIKINKSNFTSIYKLDVKLRRELFKVIKPIEIRLRSFIESIDFNFNLFILDDWKKKFVYTEDNDLSNQCESSSYVKGKHKKLKDKFWKERKLQIDTDKCFTLNANTINKLSTGKLVSLVNMIPFHIVREYFSMNNINYNQFSSATNSLVEIRNHICHFHILCNLNNVVEKCEELEYLNIREKNIMDNLNNIEVSGFTFDIYRQCTY